MVRGPSKRSLRERDAVERRKAIDAEQHAELLEKLSHMTAHEASNYLAQTRLAFSNHAGGFIVTSSGHLANISEVVAESRFVAEMREREENAARRKAQRDREKAAREDEAESEEARQRSRDLRERLRKELGYGSAEHDSRATSPQVTDAWRTPPVDRRADPPWGSDAYHVDPMSGEEQKCTSTMNGCTVAVREYHFDTPEEALDAWSRKLELHATWTLDSRIPQEPGWITEFVFDPIERWDQEGLDSARSQCIRLLGGDELPGGTRLVIENGWVLEKLDWGFGGFWDRKAGEIDGVGAGEPLTYLQFRAALEEFGGRLEFREGVDVMRMQWGLRPAERVTAATASSSAQAEAESPRTPAKQKPWWKRPAR